MLTGRRIVSGRWLLPVLGGFLFLLVFLLSLSLTLPGESILSFMRPALGRAGIELGAEESRVVFPFSVRMRNVQLTPRGMGALRLDTVDAAFKPLGLLRWLPFRLGLRMGEGSAEILTSPAFWDPGIVEARLSRVGRDALVPPLPADAGTGFFLESAEVRWRKESGGDITGSGSGRFSFLRLPIPSRESPVREAEIRDVEIRFALRGGTLHVSSFTGSYEGARVEGTGEIERFLAPASSTVTFHLTIVNPLEGKIATLFDLVAKNAKNGNLRIRGTLLSPEGEFRFF